MVTALNLSNVVEFPRNNQAVAVFKQAKKEPAQLASTNKAENDGKVKDYASEIKNIKNTASADKSDKSTLAKMEEKLQKAKDKLEKAIATLNEKQEKVNELKEKMKNTKNIFKKAGYAIAYGTATAALKVAKGLVMSAAGWVMICKKAVEALRKKLDK